MSRYQRLSPLGAVKTVAICDRCHMRYNLVDLVRDGDSEGLLVCKDCTDNEDPYKLAPRQEDRIAVRNTRPETPLEIPEE